MRRTLTLEILLVWREAMEVLMVPVATDHLQRLVAAYHAVELAPQKSLVHYHDQRRHVSIRPRENPPQCSAQLYQLGAARIAVTTAALSDLRAHTTTPYDVM